MSRQTVAQPDLKSAWRWSRIKALQHRCKYRTSRACHPAFESVQFKPFKGLTDTGAKSLRHALQIVPAKTEGICNEGANCSSLTVPFQGRVRENQPCFEPLVWFEHQKLPGWHGDGCEFFPDTFDPGVVSAEKKWHVGTQAESDFDQFFQRKLKFP